MVSSEWEVDSRQLRVECKTFNRRVLGFSSRWVQMLHVDFNAESTEGTERRSSGPRSVSCDPFPVTRFPRPRMEEVRHASLSRGVVKLLASAMVSMCDSLPTGSG